MKRKFFDLFIKIWVAVIKTNAFSSRNDLYKCLALMALAQQGKTIDEKLLDNYINRGIRRRKRKHQ
jgi:hypothetical protein